MLVRFLKTTKLRIQKGKEESFARYLPGDEIDFKEPEVYNRLLKEGVAYPVLNQGAPIPNRFFEGKNK